MSKFIVALVVLVSIAAVSLTVAPAQAFGPRELPAADGPGVGGS